MLISLATALSHLRGVRVHSVIAFRCPLAALSQTKSTFSTTPSYLPSLLVPIKLLQSQTNRYVLFVFLNTEIELFLKASFVASQPELHSDMVKRTQQQGRSQSQAPALPLYSQSAIASKPHSGSTITLGPAGTLPETALVIRKPTWRTRFLFSVCCVSTEPVDGHH